ncbi:SAM-dependent methyltransferase [Mycobacterium arosiense]|uniref:SAM-dependent methyltransferase n=1 Tax=Mycobacterium arosiense TaxID=425468 RepID=UPI001FE9C00E|nr:SAM-dependent methyltransferase [Mycobacterium arosiense]
MARLGATPSAERRTVSIDLREDWPPAPTAAGFDPTQPTAWSAEGLLVYLPPDAQDRLFDNIAAASASGSRIATENLDLRNIPSDWAQKLTERSRRIGSSINLAELFHTGDRNTAAEYLAARGWDTAIRTTEHAFAARGFAVPKDELASFGDACGYLTATRK